MRSGTAARHERMLRLFERNVSSLIDARLSRIRIDDEHLAGDTITIDGNMLVNFGSCAYLGLNLDERLKAGAKTAIDRYGPVFSSSTAYTSVPLYSELEDRLGRIFEAPLVVPTTTTLGHLSFLPAIIGHGDAVVVDAQAHSSVHLGTQPLIAQDIAVHVVPHNDALALESTVSELSDTARRVWYLADGVYSMHGDTMPIETVRGALDRFPNLWAYIDDAHGFGWHGKNGRGIVLEALGNHPRLVVAVSLAKSFGAGGAAIAFPTEEMARRVTICGGTMTFSGPLHPAELGAAIASAEIHLSPEREERAARLDRQIDLVRETIVDRRLPAPNTDHTPVWYIQVGPLDEAIEVATRMVKDGFFVNTATFPAVPAGQNGIRFTNTLYHSDEQIVSMLDALARHIAEVGETNLVIDLTEAHAMPGIAAD